MVRHRVLQAEPDEAPERPPVAQRRLDLGVGGLVPWLQQQHLHHQQRRIAGPALGGGVDIADHLREAVPVHDLVELVRPRVTAHLRRQPRVHERGVPYLSMHGPSPPESRRPHGGLTAQLRKGLRWERVRACPELAEGVRGPALLTSRPQPRRLAGRPNFACPQVIRTRSEEFVLSQSKGRPRIPRSDATARSPLRSQVPPLPGLLDQRPSMRP